MKPDIHPRYEEITVTCALRQHVPHRSTYEGDLSVEVCSACHPFYTGQQKIVDTAGRVEKFRRRYAPR